MTDPGGADRRPARGPDGADPATAAAPVPHPDRDDRERFEQIRSDGHRVHPLTPLARGFLFFALLVGYAINQMLRGDGSGEVWLRTGVVMAALFLAGVLVGYLGWRNTRFMLDPDAIRLTTGAFFRSDRTIHYGQIQSVDVTSPFAPRLLKLAGLSIDLAGSERSVAIQFLRPADAAALREELLIRAHEARQGDGSAAVAGATGTERAGADPAEGGSRPGPDGAQVGSPPTARENPLDTAAAADHEGAPPRGAAEPDRLLFRHPTRRVILAGAVSSALPLSILGLAFAILDTVLTEGGFKLTTALVLAGTFGPLASFITGHWGLTVWQTERGIRIERGLFTRRSETVLPGRVQGVVVREPLPWRPAGWRSVALDVAQGGTGRDKQLVTVLAVGSEGDMMRILHVIAPEFDRVGAALRPAPRVARWLEPFAWRNLGHARFGPVIVARRGWWVRTTRALLHRRVQGLTLRQGPLQRRLDLCTVAAHGPMDRNVVQIPEITTTEADALLRGELAEIYAAKAVTR